jgi:glycosyltransferase involved in cell wall biosynthesis
MSLSVLMSVYYKENPEYLQQALESIWDAQTLKPDEIVLVEDGPLTTELYSILTNWKNKLDKILKRVPLEKNEGLTKALNMGIEHCSGEFIARMDSDDISCPNRFEEQTHFLNSNSNITLVGTAIQEFNDVSKNLNIRQYPSNTEDALKYIVKASPFAHPSVMFRRKIFEEGLRYSEKFNTSQDIDLWFQILKQGFDVANISDVLLYFRVSNNFYERRSKTKAINEFKIYWDGIFKLHGVTWKLIYPILRLFFRFAPKSLVKLIYGGKIRKQLNKH